MSKRLRDFSLPSSTLSQVTESPFLTLMANGLPLHSTWQSPPAVLLPLPTCWSWKL